MQNKTLARTNSLINLLAQCVETNRNDLFTRYHQVLHKTLFINRAEVRPNMIKDIAVDEVDSLLNFLYKQDFSSIKHGAKLYQLGLSERVILRLGQITCQFFQNYLTDDQVSPMLETIFAYQEGILHGFVQSLEESYRIELERKRNT